MEHGKKKQRAPQFPLLGDDLVEWVDQANEKHITINGCILKAATEQLMVVLLNIPSHIKYEDYTDFTISNSWLYNVKQRHGLSGQKMRGDGAEVDLESLPLMRQELQHQLQDFSLQDVFNL